MSIDLIAGHASARRDPATRAKRILTETAGTGSEVPSATEAANDLGSAMAAMRGEATAKAAPGRGRRIVFRGVQDRVVHPANAARLLPEEIRNAPRVAGRTSGGRVCHRLVLREAGGRPGSELWRVEAGGHAWSGGRASGSFTDPAGADASAELTRFFLGAP